MLALSVRCSTTRVAASSAIRSFASISRPDCAPMHTSRPNRMNLTSPGLMKLSQPAQNPLIRLFLSSAIKVAPILFAAFAKAGAEAYQRVQAEAGNKARSVIPARKSMTRDEALKIIGLEGKEEVSEAEVIAHIDKLIEINTASEKFQGSPYIIRKVKIAHEVILNRKHAGAEEAAEEQSKEEKAKEEKSKESK